MILFPGHIYQRGMFSDTRLHISVRPRFEYMIVPAALRVRDVLFGDATSLEAADALQTLLREEEESPEKEEAGASPAVESENAGGTGATTNTLESLAAKTSSYVEEHLSNLAAEWWRYLSQIKTELRRVVRRIHAERDTALEVHTRFSADPKYPTDVVDQEFRIEMKRIEDHLEERIERIREIAHPQIERPKALVQSTEDLREAFSSAYGRTNTRHLLRHKHAFEKELFLFEQRIASDFVRKCVKLL